MAQSDPGHRLRITRRGRERVDLRVSERRTVTSHALIDPLSVDAGAPRKRILGNQTGLVPVRGTAVYFCGGVHIRAFEAEHGRHVIDHVDLDVVEAHRARAAEVRTLILAGRLR